MAAVDGAVQINQIPWRDVDVEIFDLNSVDEESRRSANPASETPTATIHVPATEGSLSFTEVASFADIGPLRYTALTAGAAGDDITVTYTDPAGNDETLAVSVVGTDIDVSLATGPAGAITSTANDIKAAVNADDDANDLVVVTGASAAVATAVAETALSGGLDALPAGNYTAVGPDPSGTYRYLNLRVIAS